ncbi:MAG: Rrf2 family transcriptional regulator [Pirellulaceae bacterium]
MFSQTSEYALRAVVWLAEHRNEGPVGNKRIASDTQVPASYLSKILHDLASAGFLSSRRGVGGGFQLMIPPSELTMLDVINAVDPIKRVTFCADVPAGSHQEMCPMHQHLDQAIMMVEKTLADATIQDVMHKTRCLETAPAEIQPAEIQRADAAHRTPMVHAGTGKLTPGDLHGDDVSTMAALLAPSTN